MSCDECKNFHAVVKKLRGFFESKGFIEVHTQNKLSILAACEDPTTMATYNYSGNVWPLPQTGQIVQIVQIVQSRTLDRGSRIQDRGPRP